MSDNHSGLFLITYEEGYSTANDPFVLGHPAPTEAASTSAINRYLIAGAVYDEYTDKGLWRTRPNAMQRLLRQLLKNHDVYGFQGAGDLRRLPAAWTEKVAYAKEHRTERVVGGRTLLQARDLYLVKLDESVIEEFGAPSLGDAWFQCLFIALAGTPVVTDAFLEVAAAFGQRTRPDHAAVRKALGLFEGVVCYSYPAEPKDVDGPQLVIYSAPHQYVRPRLLSDRVVCEALGRLSCSQGRRSNSGTAQKRPAVFDVHRSAVLLGHPMRS